MDGFRAAAAKSTEKPWPPACEIPDGPRSRPPLPPLPLTFPKLAPRRFPPRSTPPRPVAPSTCPPPATAPRSWAPPMAIIATPPMARLAKSPTMARSFPVGLGIALAAGAADSLVGSGPARARARGALLLIVVAQGSARGALSPPRIASTKRARGSGHAATPPRLRPPTSPPAPTKTGLVYPPKACADATPCAQPMPCACAMACATTMVCNMQVACNASRPSPLP